MNQDTTNNIYIQVKKEMVVSTLHQVRCATPYLVFYFLPCTAYLSPEITPKIWCHYEKLCIIVFAPNGDHY